MKWYQIATLVIYALTTLYFIYNGAVYTFVYFANKNMGYNESFTSAKWRLGLGIFFLIISVISWFAFKPDSGFKYLQSIAYLPILAVLLYGLWAISLILFSGGRWN